MFSFKCLGNLDIKFDKLQRAHISQWQLHIPRLGLWNRLDVCLIFSNLYTILRTNQFMESTRK